MNISSAENVTQSVLDFTQSVLPRVNFWNIRLVLTLKKPRKPASENVICMSPAEYSCKLFKLFFCTQTNSVDPEQTAPRGAVWSGHTVCKNDFQNHKQTTKQMTIVVIGSLRVKISASTIYNLLMCLRTTECVANSVDPGQMPCSATSDLSVQWLLRPVHSNT